MDIIKKLKESDIDLVIDNQVFTFTLPDKRVKKIELNELENYLSLCLINYIKH